MISSLARWLREEWRLIRLRTWADGAYATPTAPAPCTRADPRCARTLARLAQARAELKRMKRGLADGREVPEQFLSRTDVRATFDSVRRVMEPPVRLVRRGAGR